MWQENVSEKSNKGIRMSTDGLIKYSMGRRTTDERNGQYIRKYKEPKLIQWRPNPYAL
jgi:hypothetical protein